MRVLRVYHGGRDPAHRSRERALHRLGVDLTLVVPSRWPESGAQSALSSEPFPVVELAVGRAGDVNRHWYRDTSSLSRLLRSYRPDLLDLHEEPVSRAARQWLAVADGLPVVMYTAQNIDKRFPPPFAQYETSAYRRVDGLYPCSRQAAAVARGKGFTGAVDVIPLGVDALYGPGKQSLEDREIRLGFVGRLVPEKGLLDAVRVLAHVTAHRPATLHVVGEGPDEDRARCLARDLGVAEAIHFRTWQPAEALAAVYRQLHLVLVPSRASETWVEQFGRIIPEAQASGSVVAGYASGAIPEVAGAAGVLVPEGDVARLADEVVHLLDSPDRFGRLRKQGLDRAADATWDSVARRHLLLYRRAAAEAPHPRRRARKPARVRREEAAREFGPTAELAGGMRRPFALPVLRHDNACTRALGTIVDGAMRLADR